MKRLCLITLAGLGLALTATAAANAQSINPQSRKSNPHYTFGTLDTLTSHAALEVASGVNAAEIEVGWDLYEPQDGVFDSRYAAAVTQRVRDLEAAGFRKIVLGLAFHYAPSWVFSYPDSELVNQYGATASEVNLIFNQTLREKAAALIARLNQDVGLNSFSAIRITSGGDGEAMYPDEWADGVHGNGYWAYDANAQAQSPFPGWKPGDTSYNGQPFTRSQVEQWFGWYLGALLDEVNWQIQTYKSLGFTGEFQVLTPGLGARPDEYQAAINGYLGGAGDGNYTMGRGAVWDRFYSGLPDQTKVVAYVSSLADGSGGNDLCQSNDANVAPTDPVVDGWSSARWISYNAKRNGLPVSGENPGGLQSVATMQTAAKQMQACGMKGMYWARDANLYDGTGVTFSDYANLIVQMLSNYAMSSPSTGG
jgi:hypothetical protein